MNYIICTFHLSEHIDRLIKGVWIGEDALYLLTSKDEQVYVNLPISAKKGFQWQSMNPAWIHN